MMTTNLFVIDNVKQSRTGGSFRILLPFVRTSWGVGVLNSAIFNIFHSRVEFGTILEDLRNFGRGVGGIYTPQNPSPRYATVCHFPVRRENALAQWSLCCATNRKVAGLIPAGAIRIFH